MEGLAELLPEGSSDLDEVVAWARGRADELLEGAAHDPELGPLLTGQPAARTGVTMIPTTKPAKAPLPPVPRRQTRADLDDDVEARAPTKREESHPIRVAPEPAVAAEEAESGGEDEEPIEELEVIDEEDLELVEEAGDEEGSDEPVPEWKAALGDAREESQAGGLPKEGSQSSALPREGSKSGTLPRPLPNEGSQSRPPPRNLDEPDVSKDIDLSDFDE